MVARVERHILINPLHPDATGIVHDLPNPVCGMIDFMGDRPIITPANKSSGPFLTVEARMPITKAGPPVILRMNYLARDERIRHSLRRPNRWYHMICQVNDADNAMHCTNL